MATHNPILIDGIAHEAVVKGKLVKRVAGGWDLCDTAGEHADGVAFGDAAAGEAFAIQVGGKVKYLVGGSNISDGAQITTTSAGVGVTAVTGDYVRMIADGAGAAGAYAEATWFDGYVFDGT